MQLHEHPDARCQVPILAEVFRIATDSNKCLCQRNSVGVAQSTRPIGSQSAGLQLRSDARDPEARALLVGEYDDGHRDDGYHPALSQHIDRRECRHHA